MATAEEYARWIVQNKDKAGTPEFETVAQAYKLARGGAAAPQREPDSALKRFGMGALEAGLGVAQLASRPVGAVGRMVGSDTLAGSPAAVDDVVQQLQAAQSAGAPEGVDWARLGGNVAAFAPAAAARVPVSIAGSLSSGPLSQAAWLLRSGTPAAQAAKTGAAVGGAGAAAMPVRGGEDFAAQKAGQTVLGAAGGAVLGPLAAKAGDLIARAASAGVRMLRPNLTVNVDAVFRSNGVDPATVSRELHDEVAAQVARANQTGGAVNAEAIQNAAAADRLGVRQLMTQGQITREPGQFAQEEFIRQAPGAERLLQNYNEVQGALGQRLGGLQASTASPLETPQAGARVMQPLQEAQERGTDLVSSLYRQAERTPGNPQFIGSRSFVDDVTEQLRIQRLDRNIPAGARQILDEAASGRYSVRSASRDLQNLNRMIRENEGKPEGVAAQIIKDRLDRGLGESLTDADVAYRTARGAAAQKFGIEEAIPALAAVRDGRIPADTFLQRFVFGPQATRESVAELRTFLNQADPAAWQQVRGQAVDSLRSAAGISENAAASKFNAVSFDKAINTLRKSGKLGVLFDGGEVQMLNDIARIGRALSERPGGVSGTGLAGAARLAGMFGRLMERIASVPGVSQAVGAVGSIAMPGVRFAQARNALSVPAYVAPGAPVARNALAGAGGAVAVPFANGLVE